MSASKSHVIALLCGVYMAAALPGVAFGQAAEEAEGGVSAGAGVVVGNPIGGFFQFLESLMQKTRYSASLEAGEHICQSLEIQAKRDACYLCRNLEEEQMTDLEICIEYTRARDK